MDIKIIDSGFSTASFLMQKDEELLNAMCDINVAILHFYEWKEESATYGYFIKPEKVLNLEAVKKHQLSVAKRPTGGGVVFHLTDFAFSFLLPSSHPHYSLKAVDNYAFINAIIKNAIVKFLGKEQGISYFRKECSDLILDNSKFCMAKPTIYDILIDGLKVAGGAERLTKSGVLHQGTIALGMLPEEYLKELILSAEIVDCMKKNSGWLLEDNYSKKELRAAKTEIKQLLIESFTNF